MHVNSYGLPLPWQGQGKQILVAVNRSGAMLTMVTMETNVHHNTVLKLKLEKINSTLRLKPPGGRLVCVY